MEIDNEMENLSDLLDEQLDNDSLGFSIQNHLS